MHVCVYWLIEIWLLVLQKALLSCCNKQPPDQTLRYVYFYYSVFKLYDKKTPHPCSYFNHEDTAYSIDPDELPTCFCPLLSPTLVSNFVTFNMPSNYLIVHSLQCLKVEGTWGTHFIMQKRTICHVRLAWLLHISQHSIPSHSRKIRLHVHSINAKTNSSPGLQLRKSEQNGFHDNFLISQPNPMMWPSLKSSLRDDSNEW